MNKDRRAVITGIGAISPFGTGTGIFFDGLRNGRSALRRLSLVVAGQAHF